MNDEVEITSILDNDDCFMYSGKPDVKKVPCRDCRFRAEDRPQINAKGAELACCEKYFIKPVEVMNGGDCDQWEPEDETEED